eukprot:TRINITY_DN48307_c0_g1_i1.p1 TRINITY_DN48307_c0_g1~~TRINITY_DN48307_c0_g1_i1.p1  ORF type:complete len:303 (+),score=143.76 TRINITY_DN48307_c0_g1_i1:36-944(+)
MTTPAVVCGVSDPPEVQCETTSSGSGPAPAFQVFTDGTNRCHRLGRDADSVAWALLDESDPAQGLSLTYLNGDACVNAATGVNTSRELKIRFKCSGVIGSAPDSKVVEENTCKYDVEFESVFGCPLECPVNQYKLCSGHGFCAYDEHIGRPRCFCNRGHVGADCSTLAESGNSCDATCVALVFVVVLLTAVLIGAGVVFHMLKKSEEANMRFGDLTQSFHPGARSRGTSDARRPLAAGRLGHDSGMSDDDMDDDIDDRSGVMTYNPSQTHGDEATLDVRVDDDDDDIEEVPLRNTADGEDSV